MDAPTPRWKLLVTSTNDHGVNFFTLSCREVTTPDGDYYELARVLRDKFSGTEANHLPGPYSVHMRFRVRDFSLGIILDEPGSLDLYANDDSCAKRFEAFVLELLEALNAESAQR